MSKTEKVQLDIVCDVRDGTHDSPKYVAEGYPFVTSKNVTNGIIDFENINYISEEDYNKINKRSFVDDGDILMPMIGTIGKPIIVNKQREFAIKNVALIKFNKTNRVLNKYVYYCLKSDLFVHYVLKENRGGTQKFLSLKNIRQFSIPLLQINEQKQIVDVLDKTQEIINTQNKQLEELDNLIKASFYTMFGDPVTNEKKWDIVILSSIIKNANNGLSRRGSLQEGKGSIVLRLKELQSNYIDYSNINRIVLNNKEKQRYLLYQNDLLFARVNGNPNNVGRCATFNEIEEDIYHNDHIIRVTLESGKIKNEYITYLLNSYYGKREYKDKIKTSAGQYTINQVGLGNVRIPLPPLGLQNKFAQIVTNIEEQKSIVKKSLVESQNLFDSLMSKYFD